MRTTRGSLYPLAVALVAIFALTVLARPAELAQAHSGDGFKFTQSTLSINEGNTFTFFVQRHPLGGTADAHNVTVEIGQAGDTAQNGLHYGSSVGGGCPVQSNVQLIFAPASSQQGFTIRTCHVAAQVDHILTLKIGTISDSGVAVPPTTLVVTIEDVDGPQPPSVTSVSPSNGTTAGGTSVTILGSGFTGVDCNPAGGLGVEFGTTDATSCIVQSNTRIDAVTPPHAAGTVDVTVTHPTNGTSSTAGAANDFLFVAPGVPTVTSVNPASGTPLITVTISGTNFSAPATVTVGGIAASNVSVVNSTTITATVPDPLTSERPLTRRVVVTTGAGPSPDSANDDFTYANISVTGLSPSSGPPGITTIISGTGFVSQPTVKFGAQTATVVTFTPTTITVTVPVPDSTARPLARDVIVSIGATSSANTAADDFTYNGVAVTAIAPQTGPAGTHVTITGSGFVPGQSTVKFGTLTATIVGTPTPTSIVATAPTQATGTTVVEVTVTVGSDTSPDPGAANNFTYTQGVVVTNLDPNKGPTAGGNTVKITGAGFLAGAAITVSFGGTAATNVTRVSDTELTATAPAHAAGVVSVIVSVNGALSPDDTADNYTYADIPVITSLDPNSGNAGGTTIVKITGLNFVEGSVVKFGAITAIRTIVSPTEISAVAPATAPPGTVDVTVTNAAGTSLVGPQTVFTFLGTGGTPLVTSLTPNSTGINVSGTVVSVTGSNFSTPATVMFGAVAGTNVEVLSSTSLRVTAPASATKGTVDVTVTTSTGTSPAAGTGNDFTYGDGTGGATTTYSLFVRYTLLTWDGRDNITPLDALRGLESPDNPATNSILSATTAVFYWSANGSGCAASLPCFHAFFPSGTGVPGANNLAAMFRGNAYWVAVSFNVTWTILRGP